VERIRRHDDVDKIIRVTFRMESIKGSTRDNDAETGLVIIESRDERRRCLKPITSCNNNPKGPFPSLSEDHSRTRARAINLINAASIRERTMRLMQCSGRSPIPRIVLSGQERRQRSRAQSRQIARSRRARIDRRFSHLSKSSTEPVGRRCDATRGRQATRSETRQRRREEEESIPARADSVATETVSREARPRDDERRSRFTVNPRRSLFSHRGRAERKSNSRTIISNFENTREKFA